MALRRSGVRIPSAPQIHMSARNPIDLAQGYWVTHDEVNRLARELRPSRSGPHDAEAFLKRAESVPGYKDYAKSGLKFQEWIADQKVAVQSRRPGVDQRFVSEFPDQSGTRMTPSLDLAKVEAHFRAHPEEFARVLTA